MNLTSPSEVRRLLGDLGVHPRRALGQNFLVDRNVAGIIVESMGIKPGERILEIGPGLGALTEFLARSGARLVAVEKDARLAGFLAGHFEDSDSVEIRCADMLDLDFAALIEDGIDGVVSNLPYADGTRILVEFMMAARPPPRMVVTVQQEVADRLAAQPGSRACGMLSVWCGIVYEVVRMRTIPPSCFWPRPEVRSTLVRLARLPRPRLETAQRNTLYRLTRHTFAHRRKQMATLLVTAPEPLRRTTADARRLLEDCGIEPRTRPEGLELEQWCDLAGRLTSEE